MPYELPPADLLAFPAAVRVRRKTSFGGGLRARWKDAEGSIYEWDYKKGTVERYDRTGQRHLGDFDPVTGELVSRPSKNRKVEP